MDWVGEGRGGNILVSSHSERGICGNLHVIYKKFNIPITIYIYMYLCLK